MLHLLPLFASINVLSYGLNKFNPRCSVLSFVLQNTPQCLVAKNYSRYNRSPRKAAPSIAFARSILTGSNRRDTTLPQLVYLQYPWKYFKVKMSLLWLKLFWDPSFNEHEFTLGAKQATIVLAKFLGDRNLDAIQELTTETGFKQIQNDMMKSQGDPRMDMLKFRVNDIKEAIPVRTFFRNGDNGRKHCIIDMFFVGMRNVKDFEQIERLKMQELVRNYDSVNWQVEDELIPGSNSMDKVGKRRVLFAEILARFYREYGVDELDDWSVAFYKIASFDVLAF